MGSLWKSLENSRCWISHLCFKDDPSYPSQSSSSLFINIMLYFTSFAVISGHLKEPLLRHQQFVFEKQQNLNSNRKVYMLSHISHIWLSATPWITAHQAPLTVGFSRQYWKGLPFPPPGDLSDPGIKPVAPPLQVYSTTELPGSPRKVYLNTINDNPEYLWTILLWNFQSAFLCIISFILTATP